MPPRSHLLTHATQESETQNTPTVTFFALGEKSDNPNEPLSKATINTGLQQTIQNKIETQFPTLNAKHQIDLSTAIYNLYMNTEGRPPLEVTKSLCESLLDFIEAPRLCGEEEQALVSHIAQLLLLDIEKNKSALKKLLALFDQALKTYKSTAWLYIDRTAYSLPDVNSNYDQAKTYLEIASFLYLSGIDKGKHSLDNYECVSRNLALIFGDFNACAIHHKNYLKILPRDLALKEQNMFVESIFRTANEAERVGAKNAISYYYFARDCSIYPNTRQRALQAIERMQMKLFNALKANVSTQPANAHKDKAKEEFLDLVAGDILNGVPDNDPRAARLTSDVQVFVEAVRLSEQKRLEAQHMREEAKKKARVEQERLRHEANVKKREEAERLKQEAIEKARIQAERIKEEAEIKANKLAERLQREATEKARKEAAAAMVNEVKSTLEDLVSRLVKAERNYKKYKRKQAKDSVAAANSVVPASSVASAVEANPAISASSAASAVEINPAASASSVEGQVSDISLADLSLEVAATQSPSLTNKLEANLPEETVALPVVDSFSASIAEPVVIRTGEPEIEPGELAGDNVSLVPAEMAAYFSQEGVTYYQQSQFNSDTQDPYTIMMMQQAMMDQYAAYSNAMYMPNAWGATPNSGYDFMSPEMLSQEQMMPYYAESNGSTWPMWQPMFIPLPVPVLVPVQPEMLSQQVPLANGYPRRNEPDVLSVYPSNFSHSNQHRNKFFSPKNKQKNKVNSTNTNHYRQP